MYYVYVLYSSKSNRYYKGQTKNLKVRLQQHNNGMVTSTKPYIPWGMVYFEEFEYREGAVKREKYFKSAAGRRFLKGKLKQRK